MKVADVDRLDESARPPATLELTALAVCLAGLLGLITILWELKNGVRGIPRVLFLVALAMTCAPFGVVFWRTPKPLFLVAPLVVVFLLYPITSPQGIVAGPDPIFNFAFAQGIVERGFWVPGEPTAFATVYSYYPIGNVFMGYIIRTTSVPGAVAFNWIEPLLRLLAIPATVYAIGRRMFDARTAYLGLFLYLGTASILFNTPVQQDMGVVFFALALLALLIVTQTLERKALRRVQVLFGISAGAIVMTHHLSSYLFAGWIAALAVLVAPGRFRALLPRFRLSAHAVYFVTLLGAYILAFTYPVYSVHERSLEGLIARFLGEGVPSGGANPNLGRTFSLLEVAWIGSSILGLLILALLGIQLCRRAHVIPFAVANGVVAAGLSLVMLPLIATAARDVPLRIGEYANLFIAPFAAVRLLRWTRSARGDARLERFAPRTWRESGSVAPAMALVVAALVFMGGSLVPATMRPYFDSPSTWSTDAPLLTGADAERAASWARADLGNDRFWGDQLAINVFAGFANMRIDYGSSRVFDNATLNATVWIQLAVGDYVIVNRWMGVLASHFLEEAESAVPLDEAGIGKFAQDPHFALVYSDRTFSVYRVMSKPPP